MVVVVDLDSVFEVVLIPFALDCKVACEDQYALAMLFGVLELAFVVFPILQVDGTRMLKLLFYFKNILHL